MSENITKTQLIADWIRYTIVNSGGEISRATLTEMAKLKGYGRVALQRAASQMPDLQIVNQSTFPKTSVWRIKNTAPAIDEFGGSESADDPNVV